LVNREFWLTESFTTDLISVGVKGPATFDQEDTTEEDCLSYSWEAGCEGGRGEDSSGKQPVIS